MHPSRQIILARNLPFRFAIRRCPFSRYAELAEFHYRPSHPGPVDKTFGLYHLPSKTRRDQPQRLVGIIVYSMPPLNHQLRNVVTEQRYSSIVDRSARAEMINRELRTVSRVIIHPQFRSLGLATLLVKRTLKLAGSMFVEASAVMGLINPFFVKAGMKMYTAPNDLNRETLIAAFRHIGIEPEQLLDPAAVIETLTNLKPPEHRFITAQIQRYFLQPRRAVFSSRVRDELDWLIPRISASILQRPAYFIWKRPRHPR